MLKRFNAVVISMTATMLLMLAFVVINNSQAEPTIPENEFTAYTETKLPELEFYQNYDELRSDGKTAVVYPIFTQSAYDWGGFHDYYSGYCDSCTNTELQHVYEKTFSASGNGFRILEFLGYQAIDDIDIDTNPAILNQFDKIVLLHNEFVTKKEFDAIMQHSNVVYLYPNALTSQITVDYATNSISLVRGPSYPTPDIKNGFDWNASNSEHEKDWNCNSWSFHKVSNGYMLDCYPETFLPNNGYEMLKALKTLS
jgi:hypothetical protein